jgi:hypothetical protein
MTPITPITLMTHYIRVIRVIRGFVLQTGRKKLSELCTFAEKVSQTDLCHENLESK